MQDIYIDGVSGQSYGVYVTKPPAVVSAAERGEWLDIAGMDGQKWRGDHDLESVPLEFEIYLMPSADVDNVIAWIRGGTEMRITPYPWTWRAETGTDFSISFTQWNSWANEGYIASVKFTCTPYRYKYPAVQEIEVTVPATLTNPCSAPSAPLIRVNGTGDINVMIGQYTVLIDGLSGTILIDCETKTATNAAGTQSLSRKITVIGDDSGIARWPRLKPGVNTINTSGAVAELGITPRWRWR